MKRVADAIVVIHAVIIIASLIGLLLVSCFPNYAGYQAILSGAVLAGWSLFRGCPLTIWEQRLRAKHDQAGLYSGPCISHYARKHLGIRVSEWAIQAIMYCGVGMSILIYLYR